MKYFNFKIEKSDHETVNKWNQFKGKLSQRKAILKIIDDLENLVVTKKDTEFIASTFPLDDKEYNKLDKLAKKNKMTKTELIKEYIKKAV